MNSEKADKCVIDKFANLWYILRYITRESYLKHVPFMEVAIMEHIKTIETRNLCESAKNGGCGECQTSCQSACKTSCGIANQQCENTKESK